MTKLSYFLILLYSIINLGENMKIINKLTKEHVLKNKRRTLVTIIAITLVSILLFSLGLAYGTYQKKSLRTALEQTDYDVSFSKIPFEKEHIFKESKNIEKYKYASMLYEFDSNIELQGDSTELAQIKVFSISNNFDLDIVKGNMPKENEMVISKYLADTLNLNVGDTYSFDIDNTKKEYIISGIYKIGDYATSVLNDFTIFTSDPILSTSETNVFVYFKNKSKAYEQIYEIADKLELKRIHYPEETHENTYPNYELLKLYGNYQNATDYAMVYVSLIIILTILSIACTAIIYNSFAISLTERKKQFGILKSVGTTNSQIRKLVFKEAIIVSLIGIPLGFLLSYSMTSIVLNSINKLQSTLGNTWEVAFYPSFMLISLVFIILTILYSALFPAIRASEITPIQAIKQNKDIKIKHKSKKHPLISKLFGVAGIIAYNNIKRNKKKYRISTFAITISFLLFVSVSVYINFFQKNYANDSNLKTGISFSVGGNDETILKDITTELLDFEGVEDYVSYEVKWSLPESNNSKYTKEYLDVVGTRFLSGTDSVYKLDDNTYEKLKKDYNIKDNELIYINYFSNEIYDDNGRHIENIDGKVYQNDFETKFCEFESMLDEETQEYKVISTGCGDTYKVRIIDVPKYLKQFYLYGMYVVPEEVFNTIVDTHRDDIELATVLTAKDYLKIHEDISNLIEKSSSNLRWFYSNYGKDNYSSYTTIQSVKIIIYSMIVLFSMIAVTSIINTISTNMSLRKSEFAVLKSIGLDNKQFDKMLVLESLFLSIKSLVFAIPLSLIAIKLITNLFSVGDYKYTFAYMFPTEYFIFAIIAVFIIILLTIILSTRKNKHDNIIESIREENI